ncbi:MAG: hypothetical protein MJA29_08100 [Candidatus Omnitrophica bacterium]|nr:hypothetical protein [Candidatus Omnitrophota bacterium]
MPQELADILVDEPDYENEDDSTLEDDELENLYDKIFDENEEDDAKADEEDEKLEQEENDI